MSSPLVRFPAYRRHREAAVEANDAMMALLIGARLGQDSLGQRRSDPDTFLPDEFENVPGIQRLNRSVGDAVRLLAEAEQHLVSMAIPYVLAVHGSFVVECAQMLRADGQDSEDRQWVIPRREELTDLPLSVVHEYVVERGGGQLPSELLRLFHLVRRIRNRIVHAGGSAGARLPNEYRTLPKTVRNSWERLAGRPLTTDSRTRRIELSEGELVASLAITRNLAQEVGRLMLPALSRATWAGIAIEDYRTQQPQKFGEEAQRIRRLRQFTAMTYQPLALTDAELEHAVAFLRGGSSY